MYSSGALKRDFQKPLYEAINVKSLAMSIGTSYKFLRIRAFPNKTK